MIGDGANDCAAIKQGHIGISFASADASFSAPFAAIGESIGCVEKVLAEGKCVLVENIEVFRYYVSISFYKLVAVQCLMLEQSSFSEWMYFAMNSFTVIAYLFCITFGRPVEKLAKKKVNYDLMSLENYVSMFGNEFIASFCMISVYADLREQEWY